MALPNVVCTPHIWKGARETREEMALRTGTALVGSHQEVADRIEEYAALGRDAPGLDVVGAILGVAGDGDAWVRFRMGHQKTITVVPMVAKS